MAYHKSAEKRHRQSEKRRIRNRQIRAKLRTILKKLEAAISSKKQDEAAGHLPEAIRALDKTVSKGVIHKNQAARKKSNLTRKVNRLSAPS